MLKSPSFQMLVPKISRLAPMKSVIYVGGRQPSVIQECLDEHSESLIVACHDMVDAMSVLDEDTGQDALDDPNVHHILCSDVPGEKLYYEASLASETGLIAPAFLKKYWKNISAKTDVRRDVTTLDDYFLGSPFSSSVNWLVIDMLSSGEMLLGGTELLETIVCVVVKTLFDDAADDYLKNSTFSGVSDILNDRGFIFYDEIRQVNPNLGYSFFLKDWKSAVITLRDENARLSEAYEDKIQSFKQLDETCNRLTNERDNLETAHKETVTSLAQLDEAHSELKAERDNLEAVRREAIELSESVKSENEVLRVERDNLEAAHKDTLTSLAQLNDAHNALKIERDTLEEARNEAALMVSDLNNTISQFKGNQNTIEALTPEFNKLKAELMALKDEYSATDELENLSKNLEETTRSLKISTQLHLKKEVDYKDLKQKYSNLLQEVNSGEVERVKASIDKDPIRIIHHLSCTGGTLFAKCLAAQPNVLLLNEVDPLSTILVNTKKAEFTPTDLIGLMRQADKEAQQDVLMDVFLDGLKVVKRHVTSKGVTLIGRDHSHGKYLTGDVIAPRPSFKDIVSREYETVSIVTVRHPIDSFLSLQKNGWDQHFSPSTLDEYCKRYLRFLDDMSAFDIIRYEDFIENPKAVMRQICLILKMSYDDSFIDTFDAFALSGDSGRSTGGIGKRSRRDVSDAIMTEIETSKAYAALIERLQY